MGLAISMFTFIIHPNAGTSDPGVRSVRSVVSALLGSTSRHAVAVEVEVGEEAFHLVGTLDEDLPLTVDGGRNLSRKRFRSGTAGSRGERSKHWHCYT